MTSLEGKAVFELSGKEDEDDVYKVGLLVDAKDGIDSEVE